MNKEIEAKEDRLSQLLQQGRPAPALPPRFQESVWRRIERGDLASGPPTSAAWLERLVTLLLRPRVALVGAIAVLVLGGVMGVMDGAADARQAARDQYVASVAPFAVR